MYRGAVAAGMLLYTSLAVVAVFFRRSPTDIIATVMIVGLVTLQGWPWIVRPYVQFAKRRQRGTPRVVKALVGFIVLVITCGVFISIVH